MDLRRVVLDPIDGGGDYRFLQSVRLTGKRVMHDKAEKHALAFRRSKLRT
jgi:hypothetical protein